MAIDMLQWFISIFQKSEQGKIDPLETDRLSVYQQNRSRSTVITFLLSRCSYGP